MFIVARGYVVKLSRLRRIQIATQFFMMIMLSHDLFVKIRNIIKICVPNKALKVLNLMTLHQNCFLQI